MDIEYAFIISALFVAGIVFWWMWEDYKKRRYVDSLQSRFWKMKNKDGADE